MGGLMILVPVMVLTIALNLANFLSGFEAGKALLAFFNFEEGSTLIYVTHSTEQAALADETWHLHSGILETS